MKSKTRIALKLVAAKMPKSFEQFKNRAQVITEKANYRRAKRLFVTFQMDSSGNFGKKLRLCQSRSSNRAARLLKAPLQSKVVVLTKSQKRYMQWKVK